jgi:Trk-type K+ transport system membrane component
MELDIWWLVWGIFIVAIIERENLIDESKRWFNMFALIFELVSAFAGTGLSLGFPGVHLFQFLYRLGWLF